MRPTPADPTNPGTPPECAADCQWRQKFEGFDLQRNALRTETAHLVEPYRCGWNIKPDSMGGHPLDYEPCTYRPAGL